MTGVRVINEDTVAIRNIAWASMHTDDDPMVDWQVYDHQDHPAFRFYDVANILLHNYISQEDEIKDIISGK